MIHEGGEHTTCHHPNKADRDFLPIRRSNSRRDVCVILYKNCRLEVTNLFFEGAKLYIWRVPSYILEARIAMGVLSRKGGETPEVGFSGFPCLSTASIWDLAPAHRKSHEVIATMPHTKVQNAFGEHFLL